MVDPRTPPVRFALPLLALMVASTASAAKKAPPQPPAAAPAAKPDAPQKLVVEMGACPREALSDLDGAGLVSMMRKRCRNLKVPEGSAPTDISDDDMIVVLCVKDVDGGQEATEVKECGLKAHLTAEGAPTVAIQNDGESALVLRADKIDKSAHPKNGAPMTLVVTWSGKGLDGTGARSPLAFRRPMEGYAGGRWIWIPAPMLTTDLTWASPTGYRFGITPLAVAAGPKWAIGARGYFGASLFVAWNLLVPNDTTTLSNGTGVRLNPKAVGAGVLLDASGYLGVGVGVGHTFTSDARTDLRFWLYFGPRLLGFVQ